MKITHKSTAIITLTIVIASTIYVNALDVIRKEDYYNTIFCKEVNGEREKILQDGTRCDCLEETYAFEADFATKFYEAIGQSLHYARLTGKKPGIFLIVKYKTDEDKLKRCIDNCLYYHIELRYIKLYDNPRIVHVLPQKIDGDRSTIK